MTLSPTDSRSSFTLARTEGSSSTKNTIDSLGAVSITACDISFPNEQRASLSVENQVGGQFRPLTRCVPLASSRGIVASSRCAGNLATRRPIGPTSSPSEMANLSGNLPMRLTENVSRSPYHPRAKTVQWTNPAPYDHPIRSPIVVGAMALGSPLLSVCSLLQHSCERALFCFSERVVECRRRMTGAGGRKGGTNG